MRHLAEYMYKDVQVITDDGQIFIGTVESWDCSVTNKEEYNRDENSIDVRKGGISTTLYESEIKNIKEL
jgi:small nuclear ribonucleoprotein (snRNP)-like protein